MDDKVVTMPERGNEALEPLRPQLVVEAEDPNDSIGNRLDKPLTAAGGKQIGKLRQTDAVRDIVKQKCLNRGLRDDIDPNVANAALGTWAKLDGNGLKSIEIQNQILGLYDVRAPGEGGKTMFIAFNGNDLTITENTQVNNGNSD